MNTPRNLYITRVIRCNLNSTQKGVNHTLESPCHMDKQSFVEVNKQLENMSKDIEGIRSSVSTMAGCVFGGALGLFISGIIKLKF
jgi:hypothetical protein